MSFPNYPKYKASGVEWLGDVPEGWEVKPLRSVFKFSKGLTITKEDLRDEGVYCVNYGEIHSKYGFRLDPDIHPLRCVEPEYLSSNPDALIRDGDFVFADTSEDSEGSGNFTHLRFDNPIFAGYHTIIARPRKGIFSLFLAYLCHSTVFRSQIRRQVKGVKVFSISQGILKGVKCWLPPLAEQTAIAEFLDRETGKIDELVAEQRRLIELLKEKRQAAISHAVTKGLNPDAPMKPSGIEWLGDVPVGWSFPKIKSIATFSGGGTPSRDNPAYWNGDIPWVSPKDMKAEQIVGAAESITEEGLKSSASNLLASGRVLIVVRSGILKHTIPIAINETAVALNQDMKALSFDATKCDAWFFLRWVQGHNEQLLFAWSKQGATVESIEHSYLAQTVIPLPDIPEQKAIVAYLESELLKFDTLTAEAQRAIDLLQERRSALISAAVTGQIDVRNQHPA